MPTPPRVAAWRRTDAGFFGRAVEHARRRAKRDGVPCSITVADLRAIWTGVCPVFGCPVTMRDHTHPDCAAQLDRVSPRLGYVPGNVVFLSALANRLKGDGNAHHHRRIAEWIESFEGPT